MKYVTLNYYYKLYQNRLNDRFQNSIVNCTFIIMFFVHLHKNKVLDYLIKTVHYPWFFKGLQHQYIAMLPKQEQWSE